eukprot:TRINITY_DN11692_c0_g1_i1.p1 TRINITY_DN11692_c0_g1~~TRINITY_DN11692_c0_g1_i1.p1  ORF type:complete len:396 (+),score=109.90 TRINITY_DN11692_c0_g1_i1:46-1233(+)
MLRFSRIIPRASLCRFGRSFSTAYFPNVDASKLTVQMTQSPKPHAAKETLKFGSMMSDHMLDIDWVEGKGWTAPRIIPYQKLQLDPAASSLHYALECFEGLKAYVDDTEAIRLFRPDKNFQRLNNSCKRLFMPTFDENEVIKCVKELVKVEKSWIPRGMGYSLYLRPTVISTWAHVGVTPAKSVKLFIICSPVGPYYPEGFKPIKLLADPKYVRAWPGGTGDSKLGANYAGGIMPAMEAARKGYAQILWLFGDDLTVTEVGTMNQFFFWVNKEGEKELVTAPLDGTILPGVTRDTVLALCRQWNEFKVTERRYSINEVISAVQEGRMIESFGSGTAAIVSPVNGFHYNGKDFDLPLDAANPKAKAGKLTQKLADTIMGIQYGKLEDPFGWSIKVD